MAVQISQPVVCLDPTVEPTPMPFQLLPAVTALEGKVVGLVDNSKTNSDRFLHHLADILREQYNIADVVYAKKPSASKPIAGDQLEQVVDRCDVVIAAVGD
ncbi:MAG: hypothetical protein HY329_26515 [Chloroflexi bacterium]|nr:hypothetical protein [Chloroflexota bacterium]